MVIPETLPQIVSRFEGAALGPRLSRLTLAA
jgi:hypothetical protein